MTNLPRGTHRIENPSPIENGVWVTDGAQGFEIAESEYLDNGYAPPLETLPWGQSAPGSGPDA